MRQAGDILKGGASGAGRLLLNTKASQEAACSRAPAAIVPGPEPELHGAGVSRFAEIGSHPAGAGAAEGHAWHADGSGSSEFTKNGSHLEGAGAAGGRAGQVGGSGSSGNAENGSHLEATGAAEDHAGQMGESGMSGNAENGSHLAGADFSDEPWVVMWRRPPSRRTESGLLSYGTASPDSSVQKTALWRTRAHLSAGAARGGGSSAGRHVERVAGASGSWWRIVVAQVRRKPMRARWLQSRCDGTPPRGPSARPCQGSAARPLCQAVPGPCRVVRGAGYVDGLSEYLLGEAVE